MNRRIAIIDSDPVLAQDISYRLSNLIPQSKITCYSPNDLLSDNSLLLNEDVILYDETGTDIDLLRQHTLPAAQACLIPLQSHGTDYRSKITGANLTQKISEVRLSLNSMQSQSNRSATTTDYVSSPTLSASSREYRLTGHLRMVLSFVGRSDREQYLSRTLHTLKASGLRLIYVELMPGISMNNPNTGTLPVKEQRTNIASGISDLLLQLDTKSFEPTELLGFLQIGQDGCYHFGLPARSDDLICCQPDLLVKFLHLLRRLCDDPEQKTVALVITDSLPFRLLKKICSLAHELHVLMPPYDQVDEKLCEWELNDLFSNLPPNILKFVSSPGRGKL